MDQDDDVEHLFSWLQTPELRYREFAGAREITDAIVSWQPRPSEADTPVAQSHNTQLAEEYPPDQFPDQTYAPVDVVERGATVERTTVVERATVIERATIVDRGAAVEHSPTMIAPVSIAEPPPATGPEGPFGLGAAGRANLQDPVVRPPLIQVPAPRQEPPPAAAAALPTEPVPPVQPLPQPAAPAGSGLLGGTYRQNGSGGNPAAPDATASPSSSPEGQQRTQRSLDAVFGRLADARSRLPDPRERLRHVPGMSPPSDRPR
jgi:hypothetical protein